MSTLTDYLNEVFRGKPPSQVVYISIGSTIAAKLIYDTLKQGNLIKRAYHSAWRVFHFLGKPYITIAVKKASKSITMPSAEGHFKPTELPEKSTSEEEVLKMLRQFHDDLDRSYEDNGFSGVVYHGGKMHTKFINDVMSLFQWSNPLHPEIFGATRKMEAEVVSMVLSMYHGHLLPDTCGTVTSGGTESILMAMKTYRDWGRATRGIEHASIVAPVTAHPAFDKAAVYFGMELIKVPIDPRTMKVVPGELEKYIRYDTVVIVGSSPTFPHGVIDDIAALSEIAFRRGVGMHVDACLGGFIVPFLERTGRAAPVVDFRNRGVTSISCDTHKYGYSPKGTSTVLYRTMELRAFQFCCVTDWMGGMYCSPAVSGSKSGSVIAGTWAAMVRMGFEGYVACCAKIVTARETMTDGVASIPGLRVIGDPIASVFAFTSDVVDIFDVGTELDRRGWVLNRLQFPSGLQCSVTLLFTKKGAAEKFVQDLRESMQVVVEAQTKSFAEGKKVKINDSGVSLYGTVQRIPDRGIINDILVEFLNVYYTV
ncbi:unnamed protein product [Phytomonas sp. EM1]|nr:unnamed protein product [Phytomonas sp. EM1]|eukprot:CCW61600.1 unnamed protein product [Phytomonas sp. isolate EM1]